MTSSKAHIGIMGAGLVGSLLALLLARRGYRVSVYERRPDMRQAKIGAGRSINLALSDRGWRALQKADIEKPIRDIALPMKGRMIHHPDKALDFQSYGKADQAIFSVSRGELNKKLMDAAEAHPAVSFHFRHKCTDVNPAHTEAVTEDATGHTHTHNFDLLFGSDGAFSAVRTALQKTDRFDYAQSYLAHGYKELSIPPGKGSNKWLIEKNALHIWPRKRFMLIALPNLDGSFTCTLFLPFEGEHAFEHLEKEGLSKLLRPEQVKAFFKTHFPDALPLMPSLLDDFRENPTSSLVTVRCYPWVQYRTALIGDAAHAIVPFYGQGMNAGFEDCRVLDDLLDEHNDAWDKVLPAYQESRKPDNDAIADLAIRNFVEMRDKVADPQFLLRKKIEKRIHELYPDRFVPLYSLVTFSHTPYARAKGEGEKQDKLLEGLLCCPGIEKEEAMDKHIREVMEQQT